MQDDRSSANDMEPQESRHPLQPMPVCPVCRGTLIDIRQKLVCTRCHTICETCCEGGRG